MLLILGARMETVVRLVSLSVCLSMCLLPCQLLYIIII